MQSGRLRHRFSLLREESTRLPGAGRDVGWVKVRDLWAEIDIPTGRTQAVADRLEAQVQAEIVIRPTAGIAVGMRLVHKATGDTYLIEAILAGNRRDLQRVLCSNVINP